jgi:hypothetical protein
VNGQLRFLAALLPRKEPPVSIGDLKAGLDSVEKRKCVGFEVFTAVVMKSTIFRDMTPCSLLSCNRRFGGTYCLHLLLITCLVAGSC